jgi:hypothetical protein
MSNIYIYIDMKRNIFVCVCSFYAHVWGLRPPKNLSLRAKQLSRLDIGQALLFAGHFSDFELKILDILEYTNETSLNKSAVLDYCSLLVPKIV